MQTVAVIPTKKRTLAIYASRKMLAIVLLGFSSGLPIALCTSTLQAWFAVSNIDMLTVGTLSLLGIPYTFKFVWAPLMDRYIPPFLGKRRGWILLTQLGLVLVIAAMAFFTPRAYPGILGGLGLLLAFLSASQDIAFDAYKIDVLNPNERGLGTALGVEGYRAATLVSGAGALIVADHYGWQLTYLLLSGMMFIGLAATFLAKENSAGSTLPPKTLRETLVHPFVDFLKREKALSLLVLILLYKLGDALTLALSSPFLLKGIGFSLTEVGTLNKTLGTLASLLGVFVGGLLMTRIRLFHALFFFGVLQAISSVSYLVLALCEKNLALAINAVFVEYLCAGMGTAAFVSLLMSLCNHTFSATQFALLSSFASLGRVYLGPFAGWLVEHYGWPTLYTVSVLLGIPALILLRWLKDTLLKIDG